jgi:hypothetical protein
MSRDYTVFRSLGPLFFIGEPMGGEPISRRGCCFHDAVRHRYRRVELRTLPLPHKNYLINRRPGRGVG